MHTVEKRILKEGEWKGKDVLQIQPPHTQATVAPGQQEVCRVMTRPQGNLQTEVGLKSIFSNDTGTSAFLFTSYKAHLVISSPFASTTVPPANNTRTCTDNSNPELNNVFHNYTIYSKILQCTLGSPLLLLSHYNLHSDYLMMINLHKKTTELHSDKTVSC